MTILELWLLCLFSAQMNQLPSPSHYILGRLGEHQNEGTGSHLMIFNGFCQF